MRLKQGSVPKQIVILLSLLLQGVTGEESSTDQTKEEKSEDKVSCFLVICPRDSCFLPIPNVLLLSLRQLFVHWFPCCQDWCPVTTLIVHPEFCSVKTKTCVLYSFQRRRERYGLAWREKLRCPRIPTRQFTWKHKIHWLTL